MNISLLDSSQYGYNGSTSGIGNITQHTSSTLTSGYETRLPTEGTTVTPEAVDSESRPVRTMSLSDFIEESTHASTSVPAGQKISLFTDMQLHFIIVGGLFLIVVILALINLYIHFRSQGRGHGFDKEEGRFGMKAASGGGAAPRRGGGGYTVKMKAKPSLFI